uniref:Uncharacterized protein n=1 Tax=Chlorocebus sabaeus TaxID=60711 RepID=A0A0D9S061_CHLSB
MHLNSSQRAGFLPWRSPMATARREPCPESSDTDWQPLQGCGMSMSVCIGIPGQTLL